jgi:hypothetical protein
MLIFIKSSYRFLGGSIYNYKGRQVIALKRNYKLLNNNTKGIRVCNIIITNSLKLNTANCFYKYPIIYIYNLNTYPSNIFK